MAGGASERAGFSWEWASFLEVGNRRCQSVSRLTEPAYLVGTGE